VRRVAKALLPRPVRHYVRLIWRPEPRPFWDWVRLAGLPSPVPPTPGFKHRVIAEYAHGFDTFVETGTFRGDTIEAVRSTFRAVWSIELSHNLAAAARRRFAASPNVQIVEGDSGAILPGLLAHLDGPVLFWLDGHWCGGETAKGEIETPLLAELRAVLARHDADVILIDDARLLGRGDYPSVQTVAVLVRAALPARTIAITHDIARITPAAEPESK
jgi:hypothetical protein